ncbi:SDR family oxidoreductase [Sciscionella sediminilitoris]|uniref:SDR family oxidoreductase n=1 Tax=Sciscionella sediminilitoris TaxID=1445613 RepID=UPI0004DFA121|nr:SDR family oxidoreductase [Sciscionella sp. SE31]
MGKRIHAQQQDPPGQTGEMEPEPRDLMRNYSGAGLLSGRRALITGGDSGIGRSVAVAFAKEGADVAFTYLVEHADAEVTAAEVRDQGRACVQFDGDMAEAAHCARVVSRAAAELGGIDVVVNNVATQMPVEQPEELDERQWQRTFDINIHSYFRTIRAALPLLSSGCSIINTASVNGLRGNATLIDYSATKGAVIALTYSLAQALAPRGIRVNAVAPGPVWTPLIPSTFPKDKVEGFGERVPLGRAADPDEIAPSYVFLAANKLSSYYTGEVLSALGGEIAAG